MKSVPCQICNEALSKYKCPSCEVLYCSVGCYKGHKLKCEPKVISSARSEGNKPLQDEDSNIEDKIAPTTLQQLQYSEDLKNLLTNPHLRRIICELDSSSSKEAQIDQLMREPIFVEFADECLQAIGEKEKDS